MKHVAALLLFFLAPISLLQAQSQRGLFGFSYAMENGYARITVVNQGMPAAHAGVQVGDWIISVDGYQLAGLTTTQASSYMAGPPGKTSRFILQRGQQQFTVNLTRALPPNRPAPVPRPPPGAGPGPGVRGIFGFNMVKEGAYLRISSVTPGYPAARAGMLQGDWLLSVDGYSLANLTIPQANARLGGGPGVRSTLTMQRGNQKFNLTMVRVAPPRSAPAPAARGIFGFNYEISGGYVRLTAITPGGPAARAGLAAGDWLLSVDGRNLSGLSLDTAKRALAGQAGQRHNLLMQRGNQKWNVQITRIPAR
ncbi:PDZ domain-containing protein [Acanthopleuribacter pedis]|uniref:PDZ domain-containing protein n=1 Tax=Acanthopleuribacter pedis TaxID=442870 RepID=A0A8J7QHC2_9BACT|nr:PDZ domain-containing protein [Acanthopleuribacter pedis]MBO1322440.1 PDZ domain-containing protein [Acanthopleuribacter pedis]